MTTKDIISGISAELAIVNAKIAKINFDENGNAIGDREYANQLFDRQEELKDILFNAEANRGGSIAKAQAMDTYKRHEYASYRRNSPESLHFWINGRRRAI